jgi:hypothetical protein
MEEQLAVVMAFMPPVVQQIMALVGLILAFLLGIVYITPSPHDDAWVESKLMSVPILGSLLRAIVSLSPLQKKPKL